jgi:hypothetical protein
MKYLMTFTSDLTMKVTLEYAEHGLSNVHFEGCFTDFQKCWLMANIPVGLDMPIIDFFKGSEDKIKITTVEEDLSFQHFWNKYSHKHGSKPRAEKIWSALSDADKVLAFVKVKKYLFDLANSNVEQCHASTWLGQRRFEN